MFHGEPESISSLPSHDFDDASCGELVVEDDFSLGSMFHEKPEPVTSLPSQDFAYTLSRSKSPSEVIWSSESNLPSCTVAGTEHQNLVEEQVEDPQLQELRKKGC